MKPSSFSYLSIFLVFSLSVSSAWSENIVPRCMDPMPTSVEVAKVKLERKLWEGNSIGLIKDMPPPPWTPMVTEGASIACYGREYDFTGSLFPRQIYSQGAEILSRPICLGIKINGKKTEVSSAAVSVREKDKIHALVSGGVEFEGALVEVKNLVEFDGMVKATIRIRTQKKGLSLDGLYFEIPVKKEHSVLYNWKGDSMDPSVSNAGKITADGLLGDFHHMVWLGDYERGLCWFAESTKNWHNMFPEARIQVKNTDKENIIRINLVDSSLSLDKPLEIVFGFQATPVKPYPRSMREWQFNLNHVWSKGFAYPEPQPLEDGYSSKWFPITKEKVQPVNKSMQLLWFASAIQPKCFLSGKINPDYYVYYDEWKTNPDEKIETNFPPNVWQGAVYYTDVCQNSSFRDYYMWKAQKVIKDYGLKGIYTDGVCSGCKNPMHPCGYMDRDGNISYETKIFAARELSKRIYLLLREQSPEQTYWMNSANSILPPIYAFNDLYLNGEYCNAGRMKVTDYYSKVLSPDRIAAEYMGSQWGVAQYMLVMLSGEYAKLPGPQRDLLALIMPHDVQAMGAVATSMLRKFNAGDSQFTGYWKKDKFIGCGDAEILVSYYQHDNKNKVLAILSNLSDKIKDTEMIVNSVKLFQKYSRVVVKDFESGRDMIVNPSNGNIPIVIKKHNLRILEITPL